MTQGSVLASIFFCLSNWGSCGVGAYSSCLRVAGYTLEKLAVSRRANTGTQTTFSTHIHACGQYRITILNLTPRICLDCKKMPERESMQTCGEVSSNSPNGCVFKNAFNNPGCVYSYISRAGALLKSSWWCRKFMSSLGSWARETVPFLCNLVFNMLCHYLSN